MQNRFKIATIVLLMAVVFAAEPAAQQTSTISSTAPALFLGNETLPPIVYLDGGQPAGIAVDLMKAISKHMKRPVEIRAMNWTEAQRLVREGRADALLQINQTPERLETLSFSGPLLVSEFSIFLKADRHGVVTLHDLNGMKVGVEKSGLPVQLLKEEPLINVEIIPDFERGFELLLAGQIDAVLADRWVGSYVLAKSEIRGVRIVEEPVSRSSSAIAVSKDNVQLLAEINNALAEIKDEGIYDTILDSWRSKEVVFLTSEQWIRMERNTVVAIIIAFMVALAGIVGQYVAISRLRRSKRELSERKEIIKKSELRMRTVLETIPQGIIAVDSGNGRILFVNEAVRQMLGYTNEELYELHPLSLHPEAEFQRIQEYYKRLAGGEFVTVNDIRMLRKDGGIFLAIINTCPVEMDGKKCVLGVFTDITERKAAEDKITGLLKEKDILLRETHHRLKNNMSSIHGLLSLQAQMQNDDKCTEILMNAAARLKRMSSLYDRLYQFKNLQEVDVQVFLPPLVDEIMGVFSAVPAVKAIVETSGFILKEEILSPLAIIINELISNSMKYAFTGISERTITITATKTGSTITIIYADNGPGLPDSISLESSTGFGMELIGMLVQQMGGTISIDRAHGSRFIMELAS
ncbi:MAG: hypothetical protein A2Y38_24410 [Spirochaetes bacterium GWB1_59_5]|nr:MAG: hypothetical protein A2Y38_24410 [Spirochaetes bacterium GWB1_59_5]